MRARGLRWTLALIEEKGGQTLYRLRGLEGATLGTEFDLLSPFEEIQPITHEFKPEQAGPVSNWRVYHEAFLLEQAFGTDAMSAVQPGRLVLEPYQLVPTLRAIGMSRPRLLLADAVGLGKTIQAGVVLTEMIARRVAHQILLVTPAGPLQDQWDQEMTERFGLRFEIVDRAKLDEVRRANELGTIPFDFIPLGLASIDFLKQRNVLDELERSTYDVVVIDEAHHCCDLGEEDGAQSQRRELAQVLARRCDTLLLLTGTPHDGNDRSFASLCELLDPSLVDGKGSLRGDRYKAHVVRRIKEHITDANGKPKFKQRKVRPAPVKPNQQEHADFIALHTRLLAVLAPELRKALRERRYADVLSFIALLKRSVSTAEACKCTLGAVKARLEQILADKEEQQQERAQRLRSLKDLAKKQDAFGTLSADEEAEQQTLEVEDMAQALAVLQRETSAGTRKVKASRKTIEELGELLTIAERAVEQDPKLEELAAQIQTIRKQEPGANILVYTEYVDSQRAALQALAKVGLQLLSMNGEDDQATRRKVTEEFRTSDNRVLISTDAAAEGLNLHQRCHHLIHLELPFNPNRLEQRNGRIDRFGQNYDPVVSYLYLRGTFEEKVLLRLIAKYEKQRARLTFVPNTLGLTSEEALGSRLLAGMLEEQGLFTKEEPEFLLTNEDENKGATDATRDLLNEIDLVLKGFDKVVSSTWLGSRGLNAEPSLWQEAEQARTKGSELGPVDLLKFVTEAAQIAGAKVTEKDRITTIQLPNAWLHGVKEMPGYDGGDQSIRLTTDLDITRDGQERQIGFVGRAHPSVRRALDYIQHLAFGGDGDAQDLRVTVVEADTKQPEVIATYVGRVTSHAGREFEKVLAVKLEKGKRPQIVENAEWLRLTKQGHGRRTDNVWKENFASWTPEALKVAEKVVANAFQSTAAEFTAHRRREIEGESNRQQEWVKLRAEEIIGDRAPILQTEMFGEQKIKPLEIPNWAMINNPVDRLAAFAQDRNQPSHLRHEANGVLVLFKKRKEVLDAQQRFREPETVPIGLMLVMPKGGQ